MKPLALLGVFLTLACVACGSTGPQSRAPSVKEIAAARRHAATVTARKLLDELESPPSARLVGARPRGFHARSPGFIGGEYVDARRFWISHASLSAVRAYARAHLSRGFTLDSWGGNARDPFMELDFSSPLRHVVYASWRTQGRTIVQVDAQITWLYPRSADERVPDGTAEIDITTPGVTRDVTDSVQVAQIIRWFNALPIAQPTSMHMSCPFYLAGPSIELEFRSAQGAALATASVPPRKAWACGSIGFTINGKQQTPLIDRFQGPSFVSRVQTLLGVKLVRR